MGALIRSTILSLVVILFSFVKCYGQEKRWVAGVGINYCTCVDKPGINLNVTYRVKGNFFAGPDFSAMLHKTFHRFTNLVVHSEVEYNFNVHQLLEVRDGFQLYPLLGVNFSKIVFETEGQTPLIRSVTAVNAGGGGEFRLGQVKLFLEGKYVTHIHKYDFTTGILLPL